MQSNLTSFNPAIQNNIYAPLTLNWQILTYMYKTHGIIQTAIDMPVLDAFRGGLEYHSKELSPDNLKELEDRMEEDQVFTQLGEATCWKRLYGGGALIVNTNTPADQPLTAKNLKNIELYAANRWELQTPGMNPKVPWEMLGFGIPVNSEYFTFYGKKVHGSRVLTMSGKPAPYILRWQLQGWGMSEVERMIEDFNCYIRTKNVLYELLEEAKIDVYRLKGFNAQLASAVGTAKTMARMDAVNQIKNFNKAITLDVEDEYDQKQLTFAGIAEVMKENRVGIASALRIPMTKLFGLSASGFNSGEDDIENYNAMVESEIRQTAKPVIRKILNFYMQVLFGDVFDISFTFKPLRVMSSVEEENVKTSKQNRIHQNFDKGLLTAQEVVEELEKEQLIQAGTDVSKGMEPEIPGSEEGEDVSVDGGDGKQKTGEEDDVRKTKDA
jgi:phage-related protein (TIGR01555 family)